MAAGVPLTPGLAEARLRRMVDAEVDPVLEAAEVLELLELCAVPDAEDRAPSDADWTPTYFLARGAAEGWLRKAGRLAMRVDAGADGGTLRRSQAHKAALAMARRYRAQGGITALPLAGLEGASAEDRAVVNLPEHDPGGAGEWPGGAR